MTKFVEENPMVAALGVVVGLFLLFQNVNVNGLSYKKKRALAKARAAKKRKARKRKK
jgi:hypothetical protein